MEPSNSEIGGKLELIGELLEITGDNPFKIRAFGRAADVVERSPEPVAKKDLEELRLIPGIGDAIAHKIREIVETRHLFRARGTPFQGPTRPGRTSQS